MPSLRSKQIHRLGYLSPSAIFFAICLPSANPSAKRQRETGRPIPQAPCRERGRGGQRAAGVGQHGSPEEVDGASCTAFIDVTCKTNSTPSVIRSATLSFADQSASVFYAPNRRPSTQCHWRTSARCRQRQACSSRDHHTGEGLQATLHRPRSLTGVLRYKFTHSKPCGYIVGYLLQC